MTEKALRWVVACIRAGQHNTASLGPLLVLERAGRRHLFPVKAIAAIPGLMAVLWPEVVGVVEERELLEMLAQEPSA